MNNISFIVKVGTYLPKFFIQIGSSGQRWSIGFTMVHAQVLVDKLSALNKFDHLIQIIKINNIFSL